MRKSCLAISKAQYHVRSVNEKLKNKGYTDAQISDWWELQLCRQQRRKDKNKVNADSKKTTEH